MDHLTMGEGGWVDDFEKRNPASILVPKKIMHKIDHRRKKSIMHIQWVEKSMLHGEKCIVHTHVARKVIPSAWKG